jgi:hypothetical protein
MLYIVIYYEYILYNITYKVANIYLGCNNEQCIITIARCES